MGANILITGGSGFLGSALAHYWVEAGNNLSILVRPKSNLYRLEGIFEKIKIIKIEDEKKINKIILNANPKIIVHTAVNYGKNDETKQQIYDANYSIGLKILHGVLEGSQQVVFINPDTVIQPSVSIYAASKRKLAKVGDKLAKENPSKLKFINIRLQLMYGPGQNERSFPGFVFKDCIENKNHINLTVGEQLRDFIYIDDCVSAFNTITQNLNKFSTSDEIDIGSGNANSVRSFVEKIRQLSKSNTLLKFGEIPNRKNEPLLCKADVQRLRSMGWEYKNDEVNGIMKTIKFMTNIKNSNNKANKFN